MSTTVFTGQTAGRAAALLLSASMIVMAAATSSYGQAQPPTSGAAEQAGSDFSIPAQPLTSAIAAYSAVTGVQVIFDARLGEGRQSSVVTGRLSDEAALSRLLAGSGLAYRFAGAGTVTLSPMSQQSDDGPIEAGPLLIGGADISSQRGAAEDAPFVTPGSTAYISREQITRVQPSAAGDIFRDVPGVVASASNDGNFLNVNVRGAQGLNRVRTMVEGTQQDTTGNRGYAGSDQRAYVDPELISGVDISKGPRVGPYGGGSTAGVVNIRLLNAEDLIEEGRSTGFRLRGGLAGNAIAPTCNEISDNIECGVQSGTVDPNLRSDDNSILTEDSWFTSFAGAYATERFDVVAAYVRRREGNYFAGENGDETFEIQTSIGPQDRRFSVFEAGDEITNTSENTESILLKGTLRLTDGHTLEAGATYFDSKVGIAFPTNLTLFSPNQTRLNDIESTRGWLRYHWEADSDLIDLRANVWAAQIYETGEIRQAPQQNESWGLELWNTSFVETGVGALTLTYGLEYSQSDGLIDVDVPVLSVRAPGEVLPSPVGDDSFPDFAGSREVYVGYVNADFRPTDWLTLHAGVRYDRFDGASTTLRQESETVGQELFFAEQARLQGEFFTAANLCIFAGSDPSSPPCILATDLLNQLNGLRQTDFTTTTVRTLEVRNKNDADRFSPSLGVTLEPRDGLQMFLRYSEGFRALSLVELGQSFAFGTTFQPELEPETLKSWEIGLNYVADSQFFDGDALRVQLIYFDNDYENFVARPFEGAPFENFDSIEISGLEGTLSYDMGRAFTDLSFNYFTELPSGVRTIASLEQPEFSGRLTAGVRFFDERLELGGRVLYFDARRPQLGDELMLVDFVTFWKENTITDLFGSYELNDNLTAAFSVENLTDEYYLPPLFVNKLPSPGRTVRVNFTATF